MSPEVPDLQSPHKLRRLLIQRINHLSDQLAVETLRLFQELLKLPYQPIIDTLIVRNFCARNYLDFQRIRSKSTLTTSSTRSSQRSIKRKDTNSLLNSSLVENLEKNVEITLPVGDEEADSIENNCVADEEKILSQDVEEQEKTVYQSDSISTHKEEDGKKEDLDLDLDSSSATSSNTETLQQNTTNQPDNDHAVGAVLKDIVDPLQNKTGENADDSTLKNKSKNIENTPESTVELHENIEKTGETTEKTSEEIDDIKIEETVKTENAAENESKDEKFLKEKSTPTSTTSEDNKEEQQETTLNDSKAYNTQDDDISITDSLEELNMTRGFNKRKVEKAVNG